MARQAVQRADQEKRNLPGMDADAAATPMMAQYLEIKARHPDMLLFYRMGDFFELFFEDAVKAAGALGIQLTKRGKHKGEDIPMCGVPVVRAEEYLHKLIRQGFRVAVAEQLEDPADAKRRGGKAVVRRGVVRLVTPGTLTEDTLLDPASKNFLTALYLRPGAADEVCALASLDMSTGEFVLSAAAAGELAHELARLAPAELVVAADAADRPALRHALVAACPGIAVSELAPICFNALKGERALAGAFCVSAADGLGQFSKDELAAIGALLHYVNLTQIGARPALRPPRRDQAQALMGIDAAARASLDLLKPQNGTGPSVLTAIDRTLSAAGARELAARLSSPLTDPAAINRRLDAVALFREHWPLREDVRRCLQRMPDMARALSRLQLGRGSPRDLGAIREGLVVARDVLHRLDAAAARPVEVDSLCAALASVPPALAGRLAAALQESLPVAFAEGQVIAPGFSDELDGLRRLRGETRAVLAGLQARYAAETGIKSLKIQYNTVFGYFIEVSAGAAAALLKPPHDAVFRHRQTLANAVRFMTDELAGLQSRILSAADQAEALERQLFTALAGEVLAVQPALAEAASALAALDCTAALAEVAEEQGYVRPVVDDSFVFRVEGGRHPMVEQALSKSGAAFIANDCTLDADARLLVVTGPNMGGKSTFLRQNALIAVLAQAGSFVPARAAHIGVVDRLFSRVGASDDLARGRSTFMVEMVETAAILNQATPRSFVVLDEIGRGTATFDGLSLAWAALEHLHGAIRCRGLFATHYHELTELAEGLPGASNVSMAVKEWKDDIVFLHAVEAGAARRSYGLQVARLAGVPAPVIARAGEILARLERQRAEMPESPAFDDLPLFRPASPVPRDAPRSDALRQALAALDPDQLSPKAALDALYELKRLLSEA